MPPEVPLVVAEVGPSMPVIMSPEISLITVEARPGTPEVSPEVIVLRRKVQELTQEREVWTQERVLLTEDRDTLQESAEAIISFIKNPFTFSVIRQPNIPKGEFLTFMHKEYLTTRTTERSMAE